MITYTGNLTSEMEKRWKKLLTQMTSRLFCHIEENNTFSTKFYPSKAKLIDNASW